MEADDHLFLVPLDKNHEAGTATARQDGSPIAGSVANLANAAVGAGVLAFPYAFKCCGLIGGLVMSFLFAGKLAVS